jgi:hypothetical protein
MPDIQRNIDQHVAVHDMLAELKTLIDEARKVYVLLLHDGVRYRTHVCIG